MSKQQLPSKSQIAKFWGVSFLSPRCFACHHVFSAPRKRKSADAWNLCKGIERCHIVPESLGGSADESNLALLCRECHLECPEVADRDVVLAWIARRGRSLEDRLLAELAEYVSLDQIRAGAPTFDAGDFSRWLQAERPAIGRHFGAVLSSKIPTIAAVSVMYLKRAILDAIAAET